MSDRRPELGALCLALSVGMALPEPSHAQAPAAAAASPQVVRQKETLVKSLLGDSPVAARIAASSSDEAKKLFATAQDSYAQAVLHLQTGDMGRAEQLLNDAMWNIGRARQLVPDAAARVIEERVRYARMLEAIEALRASYTRHAQRARSKAAAPARDREAERIEAMVEEAKAQMNADRTGEALRTLEEAEKGLLVAMNRILGAATLDYAERFDSPAEEFGYELERNHSFVDLVPIALAELKPNEDARRLIERYMEQNRDLRTRAQGEAGRQDYAAALKTIRAGTGYLQRALLAAGLVVPKDEKTD